MGQQRNQILRRFRQQPAALGLGQLHEFFRQPRQFAQRVFDLRRPRPQGAFWRFVAQALDLRERRRQWRAQFMGTVGGKAALGLQGLAKTLQQMIDRFGQRIDFRRQARHLDRRQIADTPSLHGPPISHHTAQADAHKQPDAQEADGDQCQ